MQKSSSRTGAKIPSGGGSGGGGTSTSSSTSSSTAGGWGTTPSGEHHYYAPGTAPAGFTPDAPSSSTSYQGSIFKPGEGYSSTVGGTPIQIVGGQAYANVTAQQAAQQYQAQQATKGSITYGGAALSPALAGKLGGIEGVRALDVAEQKRIVAEKQITVGGAKLSPSLSASFMASTAGADYLAQLESQAQTKEKLRAKGIYEERLSPVTQLWAAGLTTLKEKVPLTERDIIYGTPWVGVTETGTGKKLYEGKVSRFQKEMITGKTTQEYVSVPRSMETVAPFVTTPKAIAAEREFKIREKPFEEAGFIGGLKALKRQAIETSETPFLEWTSLAIEKGAEYAWEKQPALRPSIGVPGMKPVYTLPKSIGVGILSTPAYVAMGPVAVPFVGGTLVGRAGKIGIWPTIKERPFDVAFIVGAGIGKGIKYAMTPQYVKAVGGPLEVLRGVKGTSIFSKAGEITVLEEDASGIKRLVTKKVGPVEKGEIQFSMDKQYSLSQFETKYPGKKPTITSVVVETKPSLKWVVGKEFPGVEIGAKGKLASVSKVTKAWEIVGGKVKPFELKSSAFQLGTIEKGKGTKAVIEQLTLIKSKGLFGKEFGLRETFTANYAKAVKSPVVPDLWATDITIRPVGFERFSLKPTLRERIAGVIAPEKLKPYEYAKQLREEGKITMEWFDFKKIRLPEVRGDFLRLLREGIARRILPKSKQLFGTIPEYKIGAGTTPGEIWLKRFYKRDVLRSIDITKDGRTFRLTEEYGKVTGLARKAPQIDIDYGKSIGIQPKKFKYGKAEMEYLKNFYKKPAEKATAKGGQALVMEQAPVAKTSALKKILKQATKVRAIFSPKAYQEMVTPGKLKIPTIRPPTAISAVKTKQALKLEPTMKYSIRETQIQKPIMKQVFQVPKQEMKYEQRMVEVPAFKSAMAMATRQEMKVAQLQEMKTTQITKQILKTPTVQTPQTPFKPFFDIPPGTPFVPIIPPSMPSFGTGKSLFYEPKRKAQYKPSLVAVELKIKAPRKKLLETSFTGLEVRPLFK